MSPGGQCSCGNLSIVVDKISDINQLSAVKNENVRCGNLVFEIVDKLSILMDENVRFGE